MTQLTVRLLGKFQLTHRGEDLTASFHPRLQILLAFILLHREGPLSRNRVAFRLWPDVTEKKALNNLRQLLYRLRKALPNAEHFLATEGGTIQWRPQVPATVDVTCFEDGLAAATTVAEQQAALTHYGGPLLPNHYDEWILRQRERLQQLYMSGLERLATMHEQKGNYEAAARQLRRLLSVEPVRESTYLRLMRLHTRLRDPAGVERVYRECAELLTAELGVAPSPALQEKYEKLARVAAGTDHRVKLPSQPTPLIGRERELLEIGERLQNPQCRLLTLVGPGGIGKTRLAVEAAREASVNFGNGVVFVSLAGLTSPEYLVSTLGAALALNFREGKSPERQLVEQLRAGEFLLLLDNYEHLLPDTDLIQTLLAEAPQVQLVVTSRERLRLRWEWLVNVDGLPVPQAQGAARQAAGAVRLFAYHLSRLQVDDSLEDGDGQAIVQITRLTGGMPLALELAAAASRTVSLPHLADRLAKSADTLTLSHRDTSPRHWSVRATFDHSWQLLSGAKRDVLARLSVFRGSFNAEAASAVTGASPSTLAALVDKSLLRRGGEERFTWHELLRQYAFEKLEARPEAREQSLMRHARHYAAYLEVAEGQGKVTPELLQRVAAELDNLRLAWQTAVERADHVVLGACAAGIAAEAHLNNLQQEVQQMFERGVQALRKVVYPLSDAAAAQQLALGRLLAWRASFLSNKDRAVVEAGRRIADEALRLLEPFAAPREQATALLFRGHAWLVLNQVEKAIADCEQAAEIFEQLDDGFYLAAACNVLGLAHEHLGELEKAEQYGRRILVLSEVSGITHVATIALRNLAHYLCLQGQYAEAEQFAGKAYELAVRQEDDIGAAIARRRQAESAYGQNRFQQARALLREASQTEGLEQKALAQWYLIMNALARVAITLGEREEARNYLRRALDTHPPLRYDASVLEEVLIVSADWLKEAQPARAVALLALVDRHPECSATGKAEAKKRLVRLTAVLPEHVMAQARARGEALTLEETIAQLKVELDTASG